MALEDIINRIKSDFEENLKILQAQHEDALQKQNEIYQDTIDQILKSAGVRAEQEKKQLFDQLVTSGEAELRRELLSKKQELLSRIFDQARERFAQLDPEEYRARFVKMLSKVNETKCKVLVGKKDLDKLDQAFIQKLREKTGGSYERIEDDSFDHGCVLTSGRIRYDFTLQSMFQELKDKMEDRVTQVLFE
ncbi:V-type ATP synthase subunit E [bacterium]|nr:V-type ATP synthase subunit E [bacterium]